jgi:hypothetical protein
MNVHRKWTRSRGWNLSRKGSDRRLGHIKLFKPMAPSQVALGVCALFPLGLLSISKVSQDTFSSFRGYMVKEAGT